MDGTGDLDGAGGEAVPRHVGWPRGPRWAVCVLANLAVGCLAVIPLVITGYLVASRLGLTMRDPTDNDGNLPWVVVLGVVLPFLGIVWLLANAAVRWGLATDFRHYWPVSLALALVPTVVMWLVQP